VANVTEESMSEKKNPFEYQRPTPEGVEIIEAVRLKCKELHDLILERVPAGRCRAVAVTNLEQVSMWANKAIVFEGEA
jgi:hypothetical protein